MHSRLISTVVLGVGLWLSLNSVLAAEHKPIQEVTPENWERHPRIVEIRKLYNETQSRLTAKKLKYQKKDYTVLPRSCRGTYPMEYVSLATDAEGRVRLYTTAQRISHDDLLTTQYYYDDNGKLRFSYVTNKSDGLATIEYRIYLDENGKVFWDVRTEAKKATFGESSQDPWMVRVTSATQADTEFKGARVKCAE